MNVQLVGVLNTTPDSFSDGGLYVVPDTALLHAKELLTDGVSIIDIGAEATNPWAEAITADQEWERLEPILRKLQPLLHKNSFSLDTHRPETVARVVELLQQSFYVNDVTTFVDPAMRAVTAKNGLRAIISHAPLVAGGNIKQIHAQKMDSGAEVLAELRQQQTLLIEAGVPAEHIILDPGIGFGKAMRLNWELLKFGQIVPAEPIMIGFSNKRFLATDQQTGEKLSDELLRYGDAANIEAAKIVLDSSKQASNPLLLRVHKPTIYHDLLAIS